MLGWSVSGWRGMVKVRCMLSEGEDWSSFFSLFWLHIGCFLEN